MQKKRLSLRCDVSSREQVQTAIDTVQKTLGDVDVLVNAAGIVLSKLLTQTTESEIDSVLRTNLYGTIFATQAVIPTMIKQKRGCIINIGSVIGGEGNRGQAVYCASKAALIGFTKSMAKELGGKGVRMNLLSPGYFDTEMTQTMSLEQKQAAITSIVLRRMGNPAELIPAVRFLIDCGYMTGQEVIVDGGLAC